MFLSGYRDKEERDGQADEQGVRGVDDGPLVSFEDAYREELRRRGCTVRSAVCEVRQVARFSRWLDADGLGVGEVSETSIDEFLAWQRVGGRYRSQRSRPGLWCLLDVLRAVGVVAAETSAVPVSPTDVLVERFECYLVAERGLAAGTVALYSACVRRFVGGLPADGKLADVSAADVSAAVLRESERVSVSATQNFVNGVRAFLRLCFIEGLIASDVSQAAMLVRGRSSSSLPRGINSADARALLCSCDRRQALGRRDYAIIITLLRLGLRRSELAGLRLDDIDWRAGELVVRGKAARVDRLPLPTGVS